MKIGGFNGKFLEPGAVPKVPAPQKTVQTPARQAVDAERVRPDASFKIRDSLRQVNQAQPVAKTEVVVEKQIQVDAREAIDEQKLETALKRYIKDYKPDPTVAIALETHRPEINGEDIVLRVDNQLQLDKLEAMKMHLRNILMKTLNNGHLSISFKMFDQQTTKEEKKLFTSGEKFEHFIKLNPVIADLKNVFGLELE